MAGTERLYYADPFLLRFEARVLAVSAWNGVPSLILDRSAFYPESGGQLGDRGELAGLTLSDVQVDDAGLVHHLVPAGELPALGADQRVRVVPLGRIDHTEASPCLGGPLVVECTHPSRMADVVVLALRLGGAK